MDDNFEVCKLRIMEDVNNIIGELYNKINPTAQDLKLIKQSLDDFKSRMDSKIEDCQTVAKIMLNLGRENKERINGMHNTISEAYGLSAQAVNISNETKTAFNKLWMRIFLSIIGATLIGQGILFAGFFIVTKALSN